MIVKSKKQLSYLVAKNLPKYPLIKNYFEAVIYNLLEKDSLTKLLEKPLIRYLGTDDPLSNFENYLSQKTFANIEAPISRLKSNFGEEYYAVLSELETAKKLKDEGMTHIKFLSSGSNPDLEFNDNSQKRYAEVKSLMEINPEFTILNNKLEAISLRNRLFQRSFSVGCEYSLKDYDSIEKFHKDVSQAANKLIKELKDKLKRGDIEEEAFTYNNVTFKISTKEGDAGYFMMYSGGVLVFTSAKDSFLEFSSVYTRLISQFKKGYLQLLKKREDDKSLVEKDRIYIYLNLGRYTHFIPKEAKRIFVRLSKITGMAEMADLKIYL